MALTFTQAEKEESMRLYTQLKGMIGPSLFDGDEAKLRAHVVAAIQSRTMERDTFGLNPIVTAFQTAQIVVEETGLKRDAVVAILLHAIDIDDELSANYGKSVARIIHGLKRISELYAKHPVVSSENFRNLLLSFAEDMRVVLILIAARVNLMRQIRDTQNEEDKRRTSEEAAHLYAPLAHKLGLYKLKSELEDLSLKYLEHDAYYMIREKLNATKKARDSYIESFISPVEERLKAAGLTFHIKGRTKSIHSIWQKMKKQRCTFEGIYDLFAIRIIIDTPPEKEKMACWHAYSIVTDMYQPNPKRLRDWLSVPKSNGYESLHITVLGPEKKWVEVQIRTERMDEIAERGVAAHWRYKGVKGEASMDDWLANIRNILETSDDLQMMDQFKMDLYEDEVYVFSPKGDLFKFPKGATVLDFAYTIHSKVGNACTGARINGRIVSIKERLRSGDSIEILTSNNQHPKRDWLNIVKTSRAKAKIRLAIKETQAKEGLLAKEMIERKFKNRKIELEEALIAKVIKKLGYKEASDFYKHVANGDVEVNTIIDTYLEVQAREAGQLPDAKARSAAEYTTEGDAITNTQFTNRQGTGDVLTIDKNVKGLDFQLAKCCQPIYGDDVFGFVTINGGIKIHRVNCPNAPELRERFGYRIVKARWSGKGTAQYSLTLRVVGNDDIGIVSNLTSIISRDEKLLLRSISIDSHDGLFRGTLVVMIDDATKIDSLIRKLRTVKGVKNVERL